MQKRSQARLIATITGCTALLVAIAGGVYWREIYSRARFAYLFEVIGPNRQGFMEYRHRRSGIILVRLPGATFRMGEPRYLDNPEREVVIEPFLIAKFEVSQAEWRRVMGTDPAQLRGDDLPVENVSWVDCQGFCNNSGLTLPTVAQWEYACRAGTMTVFAFGDTITPGQANFDGSASPARPPVVSSRNRPVPCDSFEPNAFGLHNLHGNIWEWCLDDPAASAGFEFAAGLRGGSFKHPVSYCRSAFSDRGHPGTRSDFIGFRPVYLPLP